ncbi:hypothetical protein KFE25_013935 [Diacronema lutheri]|uniref:T-complex protein 1 subunit gamma n=1 Tax=Diacronema lutheri TaxID=2081491 RepID=A0A8J6C8H1_DIALT|nr:hypothetical protein KFE25_013935 [Diacronema lutheri]
MQAPVMVLNTNTKRESGRKAQLGNITAGKAVADIIRTTLGPKSMLKMLLDPTGGIVMTNDGNAILREVDVSHPGAKSMVELSRAQDEEVGDGTTSVIVIAGEMLHVAEPLLLRDFHPTVICSGFLRALDDALVVLRELAFPIDLTNRAELSNLVRSSIGTKFISRFSDQMVELALDAVQTVYIDSGGRKEIDIKRYAKVEKLPGGDIEHSRVLKGVMVNKDVTHPKMRRKIERPRVVLLDCTLEYKKNESATSVELTDETQWEALLKQEEDWVAAVCQDILAVKPDVVVTEKGVSDLAQHFLVKAGVTVLRRMRKTDNNRIARAVGATIVNRPEELKESDVGTGCGLFEVAKIGEEYFTFFVDCDAPKACTILLRGASKDVLNEVERNLLDAMCVARNIYQAPMLVPGGGACEMALSVALAHKSKAVPGALQWPYKAAGQAFEVIPRTLAQNCGCDVVRIVTELRAKHASAASAGGPPVAWGIDGEKGVICDMRALGVWEPLIVKQQTVKTAVEMTSMLLRIDDIVSGMQHKAPAKATRAEPAGGEDEGGGN